jgi:flagellar hook-associated protein 3 FlgL
LEIRYAQDEINYTQMMSDAEDVDFAEVIMNQKMAEAVYQAALSAGARVIQPTLMDFLR